MLKHILKLYKAPFKFDGVCYINDASNHMVADFWPWGEKAPVAKFRPRGWGRIQYMENGERLHDACHRFLLSVTGEETDPEKCVELLNAAWARGVHMQVSEATQAVAQAIIAAGGRPILVGGAVRDWLMGHDRPSKDVDIECYHITVDDLEQALSQLGEVHAVGKSFGVLKLRLDGEEFDVSLPRRESKEGQGHRGFMIEPDPDMTFEEAAARRDFTINAIGWCLRDHALIDPHGGEQDIEKGMLRHVSDAFSEDPLRVLRLCQFAARFEFAQSDRTLQLCRRLRDELHTLPVERLWEEWKKLLLKGVKPSLGLEAMLVSGAIDLFPELEALQGVEQDPEWHPEGDVWIHNNMVVDAAAEVCHRDGLDEEETLIIMLGALCHDLGKPVVTEFKDGRWRAHDHESKGEEPTRSFLARIGCPPSIVEEVVPLVLRHLAPSHFYRDAKKISHGAIRRLANKVNVERLVRVAEADYLGRTTPEVLAGEPYPARPWLLDRVSQLNIDPGTQGVQKILKGRHLIQKGYKPGPEMGKILNEAFEAQLDGTFDTVEGALQWLSNN